MLNSIVAEVELLQQGAVSQAGHAGQPVALQGQLAQRAQTVQAKHFVFTQAVLTSLPDLELVSEAQRYPGLNVAGKPSRS